MNEELQGKYLEFQLLQQQIQNLQQQLELIQSQLMLLASLNESLKEIKRTKAGTEVLFPLGAGVYAKSSLQDNENIIMNVGAKTAVAKNIKDSCEIIEKQIEDMKKVVKDLTDELGRSLFRGQALQEELQVMFQEQEKKK